MVLTCNTCHSDNVIITSTRVRPLWKKEYTEQKLRCNICGTERILNATLEQSPSPQQSVVPNTTVVIPPPPLINDSPHNTVEEASTQETTAEDIKEELDTSKKKRKAYEKVLSMMRQHLLDKKRRKHRPTLIKTIQEFQDIFYIVNDTTGEEYTFEELAQLPSEDLERILDDAVQKLEELL